MLGVFRREPGSEDTLLGVRGSTEEAHALALEDCLRRTLRTMSGRERFDALEKAKVGASVGDALGPALWANLTRMFHSDYVYARIG